MGSGSGSPLQPRGRRKTEFEASCSERSERKSSGLTRGPRAARVVFHVLIQGALAPEWALTNESDQVERAISTGKLNASPRLHTRPINVMVYHGSQGRTRFEVGFPLRCFQRLSRPYIVTQHCGWRHNCSTRGTAIPGLP